MTHWIISLGSVNVDFQVRVTRWPESGETLLAEEYLMVGGGKGANVAFLARRLGVASHLLARVGDDALAEEALRPLERMGVDLNATRKVAGQATGTSFITVRPDGEKGIILAANANDAWAPAEYPEIARIVHEAPPGSVLVADLEVPLDIAREALTTARQHGLRTVLDPSPAGRMTDELYSLADYLPPNPSEAARLTDIEVRSPEEALRAGRALRERGVGTALVKLGAGGCVIVNPELQEHLPAPQVPVVDKTGAGDAFAGALAVALLKGHSDREAARFAVATAALAVTRYGSQASYPILAEVERMLVEGS